VSHWFIVVARTRAFVSLGSSSSRTSASWCCCCSSGGGWFTEGGARRLLQRWFCSGDGAPSCCSTTMVRTYCTCCSCCFASFSTACDVGSEERKSSSQEEVMGDGVAVLSAFLRSRVVDGLDGFAATKRQRFLAREAQRSRDSLHDSLSVNSSPFLSIIYFYLPSCTIYVHHYYVRVVMRRKLASYVA